MSCTKMFVNTDNEFFIRGVYDSAEEEFVNDATVQVTLKDADDNEVGGEVWPIVADYVTGTNGDYSCTIPDTVDVEVGDACKLYVSITSGSLSLDMTFDVEFVEATEATLYWTSRSELESMFGRSNIAQWADLENEQVQVQINRQVQWAVSSATEDARMKVDGTWAVVDGVTDCVPQPLRQATTRLAGVLLYESRGIKDVDESGKGWHRLSRHQQLAEDFFQAVAAGQLRIGSGTEIHPTARGFDPDDTDEDDCDDIPEGAEILL